jgi:DNA replication licensing factor MCM7
MNNKHPDTDGVVFSPNEVRQYVAQARTFSPTLPTPVSEYVVKAYVKMRDQQSRDEKNKKQFSHTSPRTLLGIVRLAQALARLRFSEEVVQDDVDEALRLIEASKESLYADQDGYRKDMSPSSRIYNMVRALAESGQCRPDGVDDDDEEALGMELSVKKVEQRVIAKGFTKAQWLTALEEYTNLDVRLHPLFPNWNSTDLQSRSGKQLAMVRDFCLLFQKRPIWHRILSTRWSNA